MDRLEADKLHLVCDAGGATLLPVKVVPGASRDRVAGVLGERLKVTVSQVAEKGAATRAVTTVLAAVLGIRSRDVELVSGMTSREKIFRICTLDAAQVRARLVEGRAEKQEL